MDAAELRSLQKPLKDKYRQDPKAAFWTMRAEGKITEGIGCEVETPRGPVVVGLHPAAGGDGSRACSADMLLQALVGCAGVTLAAVATAMRIPLGDSRIVAEGDLDFRGTLGVSPDVPVGFQEIRLRFELDCDAPEEKVRKLVDLAERYCVVAQTLRKPAQFTVTYSRRQ